MFVKRRLQLNHKYTKAHDSMKLLYAKNNLQTEQK